MINTENSVIELTNETVGKLISPRLSEILKTYTSREERFEVSDKTEMSNSIVNQVIARQSTLTDGNSEAVKELVKIAFRNCNKAQDDSVSSMQFLADFFID